MKKKYFIISIVALLFFVISFGSGYIYASTHLFFEAGDMRISIYSDILVNNSITLNEKLKTLNMVKLIEATEENGDYLSQLMIDYKPIIKDTETLKYIDISLSSWEKAKEKLQELKAMQTDEPNNPSNQ